MNDDEGLPYEAVLGRVADLAEDLTGHPDPDVAERVTELLDWIDVFHREGLGRLIEMIRAWRGEIFLETAAGHEIVGTLLKAYGLGEEAEVDPAKADLECVTAPGGGPGPGPPRPAPEELLQIRPYRSR